MKRELASTMRNTPSRDGPQDAALRTRFTCLPVYAVLVLGMTALLWGCATIPRQYVRMAEPDLTLTALVAHPERYSGKVALLGGTIVEEDKHEGFLLLRVKNRPLDHEYVPHRPADMHSGEAGYYWVAVGSQQLPREYHHWARMTVVGRVTGMQRRPGEPVLSLLYVRGWGTIGVHDAVWEDTSDPNYQPSVPAGLGGEFGGSRP